MRTVIPVSFPPDKAKSLKKKAKKAGMTTSAYVLHLYINEEHLISEDELLEHAKIAEQERKAGKLKLLKSFKDLLDKR